MRKICVFMFCILVVLCAVVFIDVNLHESKQHFVYLNKNYSYLTATKNLSFCLEFEGEKFERYYNLQNNKDVIGETFVFTNKLNNINKIINTFGIKILDRYFLNGKEILIGISKVVEYDSLSNFNAQICIDNQKIVVGFPIIYGDY